MSLLRVIRTWLRFSKKCPGCEMCEMRKDLRKL